MTEIPEHLLKRSQERRAALGGEAPAADAAAAAPQAAAPGTAVTPAAAPKAPAAPAAPAAPPPPKPDPPYVEAYKKRKKVPVWAMMALCLLPLWAFMYVRALTPTAERIPGPLGDGAPLYAGCSSCHGSSGEGVSGLGYQFSQQEVLKTFPHIEDQLRWVYGGTDAYFTAGVEIYGAPNRPGGAHVTKARGNMPGQAGQLTDAQILAVVCHERFTLGGADAVGANQEEFDKWCSVDSPAWTALEDGSATFENVDTVVPGAIKVGTEPAPGSPAGT